MPKKSQNLRTALRFLPEVLGIIGLIFCLAAPRFLTIQNYHVIFTGMLIAISVFVFVFWRQLIIGKFRRKGKAYTVPLWIKLLAMAFSGGLAILATAMVLSDWDGPHTYVGACEARYIRGYRPRGHGSPGELKFFDGRRDQRVVIDSRTFDFLVDLKQTGNTRQFLPCGAPIRVEYFKTFGTLVGLERLTN